jgi:hypothetical protein
MEFSITLTEEDIKKFPNNYELGTFIKKHYINYLNLKFDRCLTCGKEIINADEEITDECKNNYNKGCLIYNKI